MTIAPLKHDSAGLAKWIEREAMALPDYHWTRELLQNAIDADATKVVFDVYEYGGRKLARCSDNGPGMTEDELLVHCLTLHKSGSGRRDNYGVGARLATLADNPSGVTWASRSEDTKLDDIADRLVMLKKERHQYGMEVWDFDDGTRSSVALPDEGMLDRIGEETGTAVILGGNGRKDTWTPHSSHAIDAYLTRRYFSFGKTEVLVRHDNFGSRRVGSYGEQLARDAAAFGSVPVDDEGSMAYWWVLRSALDRKHARTRLVASISARAEDELFDMVRAVDSRARYGQFGVYTKSAKSRVAIVVEPGFKVQMTTNRSGLTRAADKGLPWGEWGSQFYDQMPDEIAALMDSQMGFAQLDERWLKDLGSEWLKLIKATPVRIPDMDGELEGLLERKQLATGETGEPEGEGTGRVGLPRPPRPRSISNNDGDQRGKNKDTHTLPKFDFMDDKQWDGGDTKFAYYNRTVNTVFIRKEAFLFDAATSRFTQEFPLVNSSILKDYVLNGYGTEAVANVVHVLTMEKHGWTLEEVERAFGPEGLSAALLGMHSIDRFIRDRCRDLVSGR